MGRLEIRGKAGDHLKKLLDPEMGTRNFKYWFQLFLSNHMTAYKIDPNKYNHTYFAGKHVENLIFFSDKTLTRCLQTLCFRYLFQFILTNRSSVRIM